MKKIIFSGLLGMLVMTNLLVGESVTTQPSTQPSTQPAVAAPYEGALKYVLSKNPENWPEDRRNRIIDAMDYAVAQYNKTGHIWNRTVTANNSPGTPTADANYNGWINFGGQIGRRTALHELGHAMGVGTHPRWRQFIKDGKWTGEHAIAQLKEFDGPDAVLHCDRQHFWPYGLNFDKEGGPENEKKHVLMVIAFRKDLGIDKP